MCPLVNPIFGSRCFLSFIITAILSSTWGINKNFAQSYCIPDTGQKICFGDRGKLPPGKEISEKCPEENDAFFGQDAQYQSNEPSYKLLMNTTDEALLVKDNITGLIWMSKLAFDRKGKTKRFTYDEAIEFVAQLNEKKYGGYSDWRIPGIKELYSLIDFSGSSSANPARPYINTAFFEYVVNSAPHHRPRQHHRKHPPRRNQAPHQQGPEGVRPIDGQCWSSTLYTSKIFDRFEAAFGVNFADGRIKAYPTRAPGRSGKQAKHFLRCVRGNPAYGINRFVDNGNNTITDTATGLMWTKYDSNEKTLFNISKATLDWEQALKASEDLVYAGYDDWRLPNAKELQSIVDYTRSPQHPTDTKKGPAIDPLFSTSDESAWYWTSTTHMDDREGQGSFAVYFCFGEAMAYMHGEYTDAHGAGAQRSDPKSRAVCRPDWLRHGLGPQRDEVRVENYIRCVRTVRKQSE